MKSEGEVWGVMYFNIRNLGNPHRALLRVVSANRPVFRQVLVPVPRQV